MLQRNLFLCSVVLCALTGFDVGFARAGEVPRAWEPDAFLPLTEKRIDALPEAEREVWRKYFSLSQRMARAIPIEKEPEPAPVMTAKQPAVRGETPSGGKFSRGLKEIVAGKFYDKAEAQVLADNVVSWQAVSGGWTKANDYTKPRPASVQKAGDVWSRGTFDNDATIKELRYLALVIAANPGAGNVDVWRASFLRGLEYVFNAQYPNGGYPQIYPLVGGYHDAITYNDNAMGRVMEFLSEVSAGRGEFAFVSPELRAEAGRRVTLGVECILKTQIVEPSGRRTAWCQQHDMLTLKPCAARNFEPISASTAESVALVRFLMKQPAPSAAMIASVGDAVAWFEKVALHDVTWDRSVYPSKLVPSPGTGHVWARLYELGTDKPVFGDRDRLIYYAVGEISAERQKGYNWFGDYAVSIQKAYNKWRDSQQSAVKD